MAKILPIVAYGTPVLKKEAEEITEGTDLSELIDDMFETMYKASGVGLAAPQVGKSIRLFVVDASPFAEIDEDEEPDELITDDLKDFKKVFINPIIEEEHGPEWGFNEGCLSIPGVREEVLRKPEVVISYYDENWKLHEEKLSGYAARVVQHEYDHVEGVLFTDRIKPLRRTLIQKKLNKISKGDVDVAYRMSFPKKKR